MKKKFLFIIILILILIFFVSYILLTKKFIAYQGEFTQTELINIIIPEMKDYCQGLQSKAVYSSCPTCKFPDINTCNITTDSELGISMGDECLIKKDGNNYIVQAKRDLIYGRNDRPETVILTFTINFNKKIISKDLPDKSCV